MTGAGRARAMPWSIDMGRILRVRPFVVATTLTLLAASGVAAQRALPADVVRFLDRRAECEHWMGEEPYDAERRVQIEEAIGDLRCAELTRDEARLRERYGARSDVTIALDEIAAL